MIPLLRLFVLFTLSIAAVSRGFAATIFQDGFEEPLGAAWSISRVGDGRVATSSEYSPATGTKHLVLDDSVNDALYSSAEATLNLNLNAKKDVVLTFKAKSLGNEPHFPPAGNTSSRSYDGVAISVNGGTTWRNVASLADVGNVWQTYSVTLDDAVDLLGGTFGPDFRIRFCCFDNASAPNDGIAIDDVQVAAEDDQQIILELPNIVNEGSGPHTGYLYLALAPTTPLSVSIASVPAGQIVAPATIEVPAGETFVSFEFSVPEDEIVNLVRKVIVTPGAVNAVGSGTTLTIRDNELPPIATLTLPANVTEGSVGTNSANLALSFPVPVAITFTLTSNPTGEVAYLPTVTVPAGQTQAAFSISAVNDTRLDGNILVSVTATASGLASASSQITALDNEVPALTMTLPASIAEGTGGSGTLTMSGAVQSAITVNLSSSSTGTLTVPASVTIPAGETTATFALNASDDTFVNLSRSVTITAAGTGVTGTSAVTTVTDDEAPPSITVTLPTTLTEGESPSNNATIRLSTAATVPIVVSLAANPQNELTLPTSVSIASGQTEITFTARATNDSRIDGNLTITVSATAPGLPAGSAQTIATDNEARTLTLNLPATVQESATVNCTVSIPGTLSTPLQISLTGGSPEALSVPETVTILAGQTQAAFVAAATENTARDGSRLVTVNAAAATFTGATRSCTVRDNDVATYRFGTITDLVNVNVPLSVTINAVDVEGNVISGFSGGVSLTLVLPDGSTQPANPPNASLAGTTGWTGTVTIPDIASQPLKLRAVDSNNYSGESTPFDLIRTLDIVATDLLWDPTRSRVYASVPATGGGVHANKVLAINPETLAITGTVVINQDPGQLALTSGGEYLYVALNANGTVAKVNPTTMTVISTFAVGTDPSYGTLYVADMCTVAGQPNVVVISQDRKSVSPSHNGVAVYDNGIIRPTKTQDHTGSNVIEPSADPTIFFGYNTSSSEYGFRRLKVASTGITELEVNGTLFNGYSIDIRSAGDRVYSTNGVGVDGQLMRRAGTFNSSGPVFPDASSGRVYFLEPQSTFFDSASDKLSAHDSASFSLIRRLTMPPIPGARKLIRWGPNGLAFRSNTFIAFVRSTRLAPSEPPADLRTTVQGAPNPVFVGQPLTYTITTTNDGPNVARNVSLIATLGENQTIQSVSSTAGTTSLAASVVTATIPELATGTSAVLTVIALPQSAGSLTCIGSATSNAIEPDFSNNVASKLISVGFEATVGVVNQLRLPANEILYDATRNLIWATMPETVPAPLGRSVIAINPSSGLMSDPIPINANPAASCMAMSANGRYLYIGLSDVPEVHRIDLTTTPYSSVRIPLGTSQWGSTNHAQDIEVLDGSGTSFIMTGSDDHSAAVYDNAVRRTNRSGIYSVDRLERTSTPGVFVGYNNYTSGFETSRLAVSASGVAIASEVSNLISGYYTDIRASSNLLLSSTGRLVDSSTLTLKANLGVAGRPCVDSSFQRAFLVNGNGLRSFDTIDGSPTGTLALPTTLTGDWAKTCLRWDIDGFAILGDGKIFVTRWPAAMPAALDQNADGISDTWAATYFGMLDVDETADTDGDGIQNGFEYVFGTSPLQSTQSPISLRSTTTSGGTLLHVRFPRRSAMPTGTYGYMCSMNCMNWQANLDVTETILSSQIVDGVTIEMVEAAIPFASLDCGFVRLKWTRP